MGRPRFERNDTRTQEVYESIIEMSQEQFGNFPTIRQIRDRLGISSTSTVTHHLQKLVIAGKLKRASRGSKSTLYVVGATWEPPREEVGKM